MNVEDPPKKSAKWFIICVTAIYGLAFPILFMMALFSFMIFDSPQMTALIGYTVILLIFCVPFSIPLALYRMWYYYSQREYKRMYLYTLFPAAVYLFVLIPISILLEIGFRQ